MTQQIYGLMAKVMAEVGPIAKNRTNTFQRYQFRGIDDIYDAFQGVLSANGLLCIPYVVSTERHERPGKDGGMLMFTFLTVDYIFYAPDGSSLTARTVGEAMDSSDKSANKAMSAAQKYAFIQTFIVPTAGAKDSEDDHPVPASKPTINNFKPHTHNYDFATGEVTTKSPSSGANNDVGREKIVASDELIAFLDGCVLLGFTKAQVQEILLELNPELTMGNLGTRLTHAMLEKSLQALKKRTVVENEEVPV